MKLTNVSATLVLVVLTSVSLSAQSVGSLQSKGRLSGAVVDIHAARVAKAKINIKRDDFQLEVTCDDDGAYEIDLPVGTYKLTARADGFSHREISVEIRANLTTQLDIQLNWIVTDRDLIHQEPIQTEVPVLNTTIQLKALLRKPQSR